jgi:hypothetical protein
MAINLNEWHHAVHQSTGDPCASIEPTATDLERWARMLRSVAGEMEDVSRDCSRDFHRRL